MKEETMGNMKPRERVLTALNRGVPDRVPWVENDIDENLQVRIMGAPGFTPGELCEKLGMDGFGYHFPLGGEATATQALQGAVGFKENYYFPKKVTFDFVPPWIAEMGISLSWPWNPRSKKLGWKTGSRPASRKS